MKDLIFAIYDNKACYYKFDFKTKSKGEAIRMFTDGANDEKTEIGKHPEDFNLFYLATFDRIKGTFENLVAPENLGLASEYIKGKLNVENNQVN